jgi:hypothetical protein
MDSEAFNRIADKLDKASKEFTDTEREQVYGLIGTRPILTTLARGNRRHVGEAETGGNNATASDHTDGEV